MPGIALLWRATRPFAFSASVVSALLGGLVAVLHHGGPLHVGHYILVAIGAACAHAAANLLNDYLDFHNGVDRPGTLGSSGVLIEYLLTPRVVLLESIFFWLVAGLIGVHFLHIVGAKLLPLILGGLVLGVGYTLAPLDFKYRGVGDLAVFIAFGVGITTGAYMVQAGEFSWRPVAYSLPISFLVAAILHGNNLRDAQSDREAGVTTFAGALGPRRGWLAYTAMVALAYATLLLFVATGAIVTWGLIAFGSLPIAVKVWCGFGMKVRQMAQGQPVSLVLIDVATAQLHMLFGLLLTGGVLIALL